MSNILDPREELAIQLALEQLEAGDPARQAITGSPEPDVPVREYVEIFGLLAQALEPATPSPTLRARIMAQVTIARLQSGVAARPPAPVVTRRLDPRLVDDMTLIKTLRPQIPAEPTAPYMAPPRRSRWAPLAMAAALGLCVVGMGWLAWRANEQEATIAQLTRRLETTSQQATQTQTRFEATRRRLLMVTTTARQVYTLQPLQPVQAEPMAAKMDKAGVPRGVIFVCGQHQQWYMSLQDLDPAPPGRQYFLWFLDEAGEPIEGTAFEVEDRAAELDARSMPVGTRAFMVTLEAAGGGGKPAGDIVILGDKPARL